MIIFSANTRRAEAVSTDAITAGSVGIPVELQLSEEFTGLTKTVLFRAGEVKAEVPIAEGSTMTAVPPPVLATKGLTLYMGIYGASEGGDIAIATTWARVAEILGGTVPP